VVEHAFEQQEQATFEVSRERAPLGLKISIRDRGLPFDPQAAPECVVNPSTGPGTGCGVLAMKQHMDEILFHNLGPGGKEAVLVKYLRRRDDTDYLETCEPNPLAPAQLTPSRTPILRTRTSNSMNFARIDVDAYGHGIVALAKRRLRERCFARYDVIHLYPDLFDALTEASAGQLENLGFFFTGIIPGSLPGGDALILQYLNNDPIDYDRIKVASQGPPEN
jgi:hypothetical protein